MEEKNDINQVLPNKKMLGIRIGIILIIILAIASIFILKSLGDNKSVLGNGSLEDDTIPFSVSEIDLNKLKSYKLPMVIDFGADQCIPCQQMAPVLETMYEEFQGKAIVQFVDVWEYTTAADGFPVSLIPTQIFYNADGAPYIPSESIQESIEFTMYSDKTTKEHIFTVHQGGLTEEQMRKIFAEMGVE